MLVIFQAEHVRSNVTVKNQYARLVSGEKVQNAFTTRYLNVADLIDVLVNDRINLVELALPPLVLLVLLVLRSLGHQDQVLGLHLHLQMRLALGQLVVIVKFKGSRRVEPQMLRHLRTHNRRCRLLVAQVL